MPYIVVPFVGSTITDYRGEQFDFLAEAVAFAEEQGDLESGPEPGAGFLVVSSETEENNVRWGVWPVCHIVPERT
jgi:hypothetical protein